MNNIPGGVLGPATYTRGPLWSALVTADGDGIAGQSILPAGQTGDFLLGTLKYNVQAIGTSVLTPAFTAGDNTEGILYDGTEFPPVFGILSVTATSVPEPAGLAIGAFGLFGLNSFRARRPRSKEKGAFEKN